MNLFQVTLTNIDRIGQAWRDAAESGRQARKVVEPLGKAFTYAEAVNR